MPAALTPTYYSAEEYLTLERSASYKNEFRDGQIYAMTGSNRNHNLVTGNIGGELSLQLKKTPLRSLHEQYAGQSSRSG